MANKNTEPKEGFFQKILGLIFRNSDPEAEKKRLLRNISKELSRCKYKFYKYSSDEALPQLAKFFYEIYKTIGPAQAMIQSIPNPNVFKNAVISYAMTESQHALIDKLSEEAIFENAKTMPVKQLTEKVKNDLSAFITEFDTEKIQNIDKIYSKILAFNAFCTFDYYFLLKKFDSNLHERDFNYIPKFDTIRADYICDDLKDFLDVAWALPISDDWSTVMKIFKAFKGVDPVAANQWNKLLSKLSDLRNSRVFEMIIQLTLKDPTYQQAIKTTNERIFEPYLDKIRTQTTLTIKKIEQARTNSKVEELLNNLFGTTVVLRLKNYTEAANANYEKKMLAGYLHHLPLNYMKAFLTDYFKKNVREFSDLVLIRGKWVTAALSTQMSEAYHTILSISDQLNEFDASLSDEAEQGIKMKNLLLRCDKDPDSGRIIRTQLKDINDKALFLLTAGSQNLVQFAREVKSLLEDRERPTPQLLINWKEIEHFSDKPFKELGVSIYKMIHQFITLMQIFLKQDD